MMNGGFFDGVVPDREDQVGAVDRLVQVVAARSAAAGAPIQSSLASSWPTAATVPLPIWVLKNGMPVRRMNSVS